jgi:hypothetical protein
MVKLDAGNLNTVGEDTTWSKEARANCEEVRGPPERHDSLRLKKSIGRLLRSTITNARGWRGRLSTMQIDDKDATVKEHMEERPASFQHHHEEEDGG